MAIVSLGNIYGYTFQKFNILRFLLHYFGFIIFWLFSKYCYSLFSLLYTHKFLAFFRTLYKLNYLFQSIVYGVVKLIILLLIFFFRLGIVVGGQYNRLLSSRCPHDIDLVYLSCYKSRILYLDLMYFANSIVFFVIYNLRLCQIIICSG